MKILFLYTELAEYFLACVNTLIDKSNTEVHIVRWRINEEAPFTFSFDEKLKIYDRNDFAKKSLLELTEKISPEIIYCSGWVDKDYLAVCKKYRNKIPVIVGFDGKWKGSLKQRLASLFKNVIIKKYFSHCWIPGSPQLKLAAQLGFDKKNTLTGFYSCDYTFFHTVYSQTKEFKKNKFPHRFIYVGRYYKFKGIEDLWRAFSEIAKESPNDWDLWCFGAGNIPPMKHPQIKHFGFVQPKDMTDYISKTGVFVLPSRFEPWGVAVHEFASAGFPLICSNEVGAASTFLEDNVNGFMFQSKNIKELKSIMTKIISTPDEKLFQMGSRSADLANQITPEKWANTLSSIIPKHILPK